MNNKYLLSIDQSTQSTKALLFDREGNLLFRTDMQHRQIVNEYGWVSHDPNEIYAKMLDAVRKLVEDNGIEKNDIIAIGLSNQRETVVLWDKITGKPMADAIVWQCARASSICEKDVIKEKKEIIRERTGLPLSPYFPAAKIAWLLEKNEIPDEKIRNHEICHGTIDSWLIYKLTNGRMYKTDFSNASRTQLFNIMDLRWDEEICEWFGIDMENLPEVTDSDDCFGETTMNGFFEKPIPIHSVMGDSHAALFGQACLSPGMMKVTYGTGSSIMMNIGKKPILSKGGVSTSLAWSRGGNIEYVMEGNLNYSGAIITWLKDHMKMIQSPKETDELAKKAKDDGSYLVPAFTGLGAPYWDSEARAALVGMNRMTDRETFIRAGVESIAYQVYDVIEFIKRNIDFEMRELRVDGGPTRNDYLMQFQSDILNQVIMVAEEEELSGIGAAYMAGMAMGIWNEEILMHLNHIRYVPGMCNEKRHKKIEGWKNAVKKVLTDKNQEERT